MKPGSKEELEYAEHELNEMIAGMKDHGLRGQRYWVEWINHNPWFTNLYKKLLREKIEQLGGSEISLK